MKERVKVSLDVNNAAWLRDQSTEKGELSEAIDRVIKDQRLYGSIEARINKLVDRLAAVVATAERAN